jgi:hypothetical protein
MKHTAAWLQLNRRVFRASETLCDTLKPQISTNPFACVCHSFLRRGGRTLRAVNALFEKQLIEQAQALVRSLLENNVNFHWFIHLSESNRLEAMRLYLDAMMLDWIRQASEGRSVGFLDPCDQHEIERLAKTESEIRARYSSQDFQKMKKFGFTKLPFEQRARKIGLEQIYCVVYRTFSRPVHSSDFAEQRAITAETNLESSAEILENITFCTGLFSVVGVTTKVNDLFRLAEADKMNELWHAYDRLGRKTGILSGHSISRFAASSSQTPHA